jgi:hypothetical protein
MSENTKGRRPETSHKAGAACEAGRMRCFKHVFYAIRILASSALPLQAQYQGYQFLGFTGLQAGTQPSQGYYVIIPLYYAWYDLSIYNPQGNNIFKNATEGMNLFVLPNLQVVTPFKILGANYGASVTQYVVNGRVDVAARNFSRSVRTVLGTSTFSRRPSAGTSNAPTSLPVMHCGSLPIPARVCTCGPMKSSWGPPFMRMPPGNGTYLH